MPFVPARGPDDNVFASLAVGRSPAIGRGPASARVHGYCSRVLGNKGSPASERLLRSLSEAQPIITSNASDDGTSVDGGNNDGASNTGSNGDDSNVL